MAYSYLLVVQLQSLKKSVNVKGLKAQPLISVRADAFVALGKPFRTPAVLFFYGVEEDDARATV